MKRCLDEAMLQSYFDGELSTELMESATSHLASCGTCAAAARELEQENELLMAALAAEFDAPVPTEALRTRIDAAVMDLNAPLVTEKSGFFSSFTNLFNFVPHQALAYGGLIVVLAFGVVFGIVKMRSGSNDPAQIAKTQSTEIVASGSVPSNSPEQPSIPPVKMSNSDHTPKPVVQRVSFTPRRSAAKPERVKLFPGERAYLQTIARLDSAIKAEKKEMRPALQVEYERNLAVVDHAIAATRTAAKKNPNDPDAADFMFAAYQSKVNLLNTIADARVGGCSH